ncbi:SGNH/GDSL hydrolase family protein [Alicyclobacillus kakegawensis]|uniref:SGNH/GDSL hydrolase family protein n=1 Tax=Alicyclobacillus kakegawensis TaxID=392012 RepID=UPI000833C351|nr:GDSL-type esterase/lipase family protein [Alicyclobacillus kakegawensis]
MRFSRRTPRGRQSMRRPGGDATLRGPARTWMGWARAGCAVLAAGAVFAACMVSTVPIPRQLASAKPKTLVALGDSIPFGWQLPDASSGHPSPDAFPYMVGRRLGYRVQDLAVPGATSQDLLRQLNSAKLKAALRQANVVLIDVGSNDLLHAANDVLTNALSGRRLPGRSDAALFSAALAAYARTLPQVVARVQAQTDAPIVLIDLYNPFPDGTILHDIAEPLLAAGNQTVLNTAAQTHCLVASAYEQFNHRQAEYVRLQEDDMHPNARGQKALADAVLTTLDSPLWHQPMYYALAPKGAIVRSQSVIGSNGISWLHGDQADVVIGKSGSWLEVVTPEGKTGFVEQKSVRLLLRPWNNDSFATFRTPVTPVRLQIEHGRGGISEVSGFAWSGWIYAPVADLARAAGETMTWDETNREADVTTPEVAAWDLSQDPAKAQAAAEDAIAAGIPGAAGSKPAAARPRLILPSVHAYTAKQRTVTVRTRGILVKIDGEDTNLRAQPLVIGGRIYVPAPAFWQALGLPLRGATTPPAEPAVVPSYIRPFPG